MANLELLYKNRPVEEVTILLARASMIAKGKVNIKSFDIQNELKIGYAESVIILDWLADSHQAEPNVSTHWIRCGRAYVLNNFFPNLVEMEKVLEVGERRAFLIMLELEKKGIIFIKPDFTFKRRVRMSSFRDLVRQMKPVAKKYRGRCEPALLARTLYIDLITAFRLAQYGEEHLGLRWKNRSKDIF